MVVRNPGRGASSGFCAQVLCAAPIICRLKAYNFPASHQLRQHNLPNSSIMYPSLPFGIAYRPTRSRSIDKDSREFASGVNKKARGRQVPQVLTSKRSMETLMFVDLPTGQIQWVIFGVLIATSGVGNVNGDWRDRNFLVHVISIQSISNQYP
jgi:hypothetical protein